MVGRTASRDQDFADRVDIFRRPVQFFEVDMFAVFRDAAAHGIFDGLRLFIDFLEHEVFEAAFFSRFGIPVDFKDFLGNGFAFEVRDPDIIFHDDGDFPIIHDIRLAGIAEDGRDIRGDVVFALAETDDERIILLAANDLIRFKFAHEDQRIRTAQTAQDFADRAGEIPVVHVGAQVGDDFRIRFRLEVIPFLEEFFLQFHVVFDDAVVDDGEITFFIRMGMGVDIRRTAMSCPTGMADADRADDRMSLYGFSQVDQTACLFADSNGAVMIDGDTGRIITAVFQLCQTIHQKICCFSVSDVTYNTTHSYILLI